MLKIPRVIEHFERKINSCLTDGVDGANQIATK